MTGAQALLAALMLTIPAVSGVEMSEAAPRYEPYPKLDTQRAPKQQRTSKQAKPDPKKASTKETAKAEPKPTGPLVLSISLNSQHLTVFDGEEAITSTRISSGKIGHSTPLGVYSVIEKKRMHHSNIYSGAPMPHMQRITWSGIALHAGVVPGYPASHGCVRLPSGFAGKLFGMTRVGTRVIIARDLKEPRLVSHPWLEAVSGPDAIVAAIEKENPAERRKTPAERRAEALAVITTDIREAGFALAGLRAGIGRVTADADAKRAVYEEKRAEVGRLEAEWRRAELARGAAKRDLDKFTRTRLARLDTGTANDASPQETERQTALEERFAAAADAADDSELSFKTAETALAPVEDEYKAAAEARDAVMTAIEAAEQKLKSATEAEKDFKRREAKRAEPVSVLISRAKGRLYVRQGWDEIFEVPVTFDRPDDLVGTHVFTALEPEAGSKAVRWSVVSIETPTQKPAKSRRDKDAKKQAAPEPAAEVAASPQTVEAAFARLGVPVEARDEIADLMKPGSSIIVSDFGLGTETGEYTDFIVQTRQ